MANRSKDWNESLAKELRDLDFAAEFIMASIEEGATIQEALTKVIRLYGVIEFAKLANMASPNVIRSINPRYNPTQQTLNRLLQPFGLIIGVRPASIALAAA